MAAELRLRALKCLTPDMQSSVLAITADLPSRLSQAVRQDAGEVLVWAENPVYPAATFEQQIWSGMS